MLGPLRVDNSAIIQSFIFYHLHTVYSMLSFFFNNLDIFLSMAPAAGWDHSAAFTRLECKIIVNWQIAQTIHSIFWLSTLSTLIHRNYVESCPPREMPISRHFAVIHQVIHIIHRFFPPHRWILRFLNICFIFVNIL